MSPGPSGDERDAGPLLDPHTSYRGSGDDAGNIVDLEYVRVNVAAWPLPVPSAQRSARQTSARRVDPRRGGSDREVGRRVLETGQPLSVDEFEIELFGIGPRRLDVRAVRVGRL